MTRRTEWRKPADGYGVPREWTPSERFQLYASGWRAGAALRAMDPNRADCKDYDAGYAAGAKTRCATIARFAKKVGYVPQILRTCDATKEAGR